MVRMGDWVPTGEDGGWGPHKGKRGRGTGVFTMVKMGGLGRYR